VAIKGMTLNILLKEEEIEECAVSWKNHSKNILNEKILFSVCNNF
jgi:hypothetical protein